MRKPRSSGRVRAPVTNEDIYLALGAMDQKVDNFKEKVEAVEESGSEIRHDLADLRVLVAEQARANSEDILRLTASVEHLARTTQESIKSINDHIKAEVDPTVSQVRAWTQRGVGVLAVVGMMSTSGGVLLTLLVTVYWEPMKMAIRRLLGIN